MNPLITRTLRTIADLVGAGLVAPELEVLLSVVTERYAVAVPPVFAGLIDPTDPTDPIARQFIPDLAELRQAADEMADPIGDGVHAPVYGIVHRYPDRVLLTPTFACSVYCRFCFRRERVGLAGNSLDASELELALSYIRSHPEIWEVILTGGDPLVLAPRRLALILAALDAMPQLGVLRIHTRVPLAAPELVDAALLVALRVEKSLFVAVHANHPSEFTPAACAALRRLIDAGIPLLGQTVLLAGVNDDTAVLESLFRRFVENRIKPYYLHHLDPAPGTERFRVPIARGQELMRGLHGRVSGLCRPGYVLDIPGGFGKSSIAMPDISADGGTISDWQGGCHPGYGTIGCTDKMKPV
ncbi:MAG: lysine-2,3-aminomutase-like protein [Rhodospirillaceae bacterium]